MAKLFGKPLTAPVQMPAIVGDTWLNSDPLSPSDLAGKVVLADFWTYSCVNCLRTMPFLRRWWEKYQGRDFLMIGIHAPEFAFEKAPDNVQRAVDELGVGWPVVLDNRFENWHNFTNSYWPAKYLADTGGRIVYEHFGEGEYQQTESQIQDLLSRVGDEPLPPLDPEPVPRMCVHPTPETYCGYGRGRLENSGGHLRNREAPYEAPREMRTDSIALSGEFTAQREYVEAAEGGAALLLSFRGTEVNLVMEAGGDRAEALLGFEGSPPRTEISGSDVDEQSLVTVEEPRMYNLLKADRPLEGRLSVTSVTGSFRAYAFTFSGCLD